MTEATDQPKYKRILLKLSGEALMGEETFGLDPKVLDRMALEIKQLIDLGVQVGVVIGGGNLFRGQKLAESGMGRVAGDHMGMLATVMNSLAMQDALERTKIPTRVMSAVSLTGVCDDYDHRYAQRYLEKGEVIIFCAGTGNPFFTTDTAACLRGIEIKADIILKATQVDGVYSADPKTHPDAIKYDKLSYAEVLEQEFAIMDLTAFCLARDHNKSIRVFNMSDKGSLMNIVMGHPIGTLIE